jgi:hypothetical protein
MRVTIMLIVSTAFLAACGKLDEPVGTSVEQLTLDAGPSLCTVGSPTTGLPGQAICQEQGCTRVGRARCPSSRIEYSCPGGTPRMSGDCNAASVGFALPNDNTFYMCCTY